MTAPPSPFELVVQGVFDALPVRAFDGEERVSTPYAIAIDADLPPRSERPLLGARARLLLRHVTGTTRAIHGVLAEIERRAPDVHGVGQLHVVLEPRFAELRHTRHRRVFHDQTSVETARQILNEHGVAHRLRLLDGYPKHTHRIQYDESDLAFVERILFEEGIYYFFDHPSEMAKDDSDATSLGTSEVLVLCDTARYHPSLEPASVLHHRAFAHDEQVTGDATTAFYLCRRERVRQGALIGRGRDVTRPSAELGDDDDRRVSGPSRPAWQAVLARRPRLVAEHQGSLEDRPVAVPPARRLLDEGRVASIETTGRSLCPYLMPGRVFQLEGHEDPEIAAGHVVVAVDHEGRAPRQFAPGQEQSTTYQNRLVTAPAETALRPARRPKPRTDGVDTGTVVGPKGQEIHTDEHGRVKVQFHWDLEGPGDHTASAWLRVVQAWGGAGFGAQFLPRIGMEVAVSFVSGDVDRPVVVGCLHNGESPAPFRYPDEQTMVGLRTRTSPGGGGLHEIVLDDAVGKERISIRSEGHLAVFARGEHSISSEGGTREATASRRSRVEQEDMASVGGDVRREIGGARAVQISRDDVLEVGGEQAEHVGGNSVRRVSGKASEEIAKSYDLAVGAGESGGSASVRVNGPVISSVRDRFMVFSEHSVVVQVGETRLEMDAAGIRMAGRRISLEADRIDLVAKGSSLALAGSAGLNGGTVVVSSKGAQLKLDAHAHLDGGKVLLNCGKGAPIGAAAGTDPDKSGTLTFQVTNPEALHGQSVVGTFLGPDGTTVERPIGPDGKVVFEGNPGDRWTLVDVRAGATSWAKRGE